MSFHTASKFSMGVTRRVVKTYAWSVSIGHLIVLAQDK